jgi:holo-[acyl-carrier protein] synthase
MIVGLGMDVVEVARIARQLDAPSADRFLARCFTERERGYCDRHRDRANRYAARFAAKEAASKALGVPQGIRFTDVEVVKEEGAPALALAGVAAEAARARGVSRIHLTLTHDGGIAAAAVILEAT